MDELLQNEEIAAVIKEVILQLRNESNLTIPGIEIPDPLPVPDANMTVDKDSTKADLQMWNGTVSGLSYFSLDEINASLNDMNLTVGLNLSTIMVDGQYKLKGRYGYLRLSGRGDYWMKLYHCYVSGSLSLKLNSGGFLEVDSTNLDFYVRDIKLHFENFLGGGSIATFGNIVINTFSRLIFEQTKPYILDELENTMIKTLNEKFVAMKPQPPVSQKTSPLDLAIANTATQIREHGYDPFSAPDYQQNFKGKFLIIRFSGNISLYSGYLNGLSTIHRTGPIQMTFKDNHLVATAELGFENLEGGYKWDATLMRVSRKGGVHFSIRDLNLLLRVTQQNKLNSHPQITELKIVNLQKIVLDMDGLGSFDFLIEFFTNFFTNVFKKQFALITETQLKRIIQKNLEKVQLPF